MKKIKVKAINPTHQVKVEEAVKAHFLYKNCVKERNEAFDSGTTSEYRLASYKSLSAYRELQKILSDLPKREVKNIENQIVGFK